MEGYLSLCYYDISDCGQGKSSERTAFPWNLRALTRSFRRLLPPTWRPYQYEPLLEGHFRLITILPGTHKDPIQLRIEQFEFATAPPYCALSYVWGDPKPRHLVWIGHETLATTENLHAALIEIRSTSAALTIWIDAIGINQSDDDDKNMQLPLMTTLFPRAERVIAWLGKDDGSSAVVFDMFVQWAHWDQYDADAQRKLTSETQSIIMAESSTIREMMRTFCKREFFERAWTLQEVCTPADRPPIFRCGGQVIRADTVQAALGPMFKMLTSVQLLKLFGPKGIDITNTVRATFQDPGQYKPFYHAVTHMERRKASKVVDHIYAARGMFCAPGTSYPAPNYNSPVHEVFASYTRASIRQERSLTILTHVRPDEDHWDIPSWAVKPPQEIPKWGLVETFLNSAFCATGDSLVVGLESSRDCDRCLPLRVIPVDSIVQYWSPEPGMLQTLLRVVDDHDHPWALMRRALQSIRADITRGLDLPDICDTTVSAIRECMTCNEFFLSASHHHRLEDVYHMFTEQLFAAYLREANLRHVDTQWDHTELLDQAHALLNSVDETPSLDTLSHASPAARLLEKIVARFFIEHLKVSLFGRQLALMRSGNLALVPVIAQIGDEICLMLVGSTPFVLRRTDGAGDTHTLVGDAYVNGIMYGELYNKPGNVVVEYRLV
ncbi:hypothetical protein LTR95_013756 [Oleoguttula sp. CCFEE 5521]